MAPAAARRRIRPRHDERHDETTGGSDGRDMSEPLVIIGNGMATARRVEERNARALGRYAIAVIGDEPRLAYNRVLLSSVLAREVSQGDIELKSADWWRAHGVTLLYGHRATAIDADIRRVRLAFVA